MKKNRKENDNDNNNLPESSPYQTVRSEIVSESSSKLGRFKRKMTMRQIILEHQDVLEFKDNKDMDRYHFYADVGITCCGLMWVYCIYNGYMIFKGRLNPSTLFINRLIHK